MPNKLSPREEERVTKMVARGVPYTQICEQFDLARVTVHRIAARNGVRMPIGKKPRNLSKKETAEIIRLASKKVSQREIGEKFGLSQS